MIRCSKCTAVFGGTGGWLLAMTWGWIWKRIEGKEVILCPKCAKMENENG